MPLQRSEINTLSVESSQNSISHKSDLWSENERGKELRATKHSWKEESQEIKKYSFEIATNSVTLNINGHSFA